MQNNILSKRRLFFPPEKLTISYIKSIIKKFYNIVKRLDLIWFFFKLNVNSWFAQKNKMFFTLCVIKLLAFYFNFKIALFVLFSIALFAAEEPFLLNFTFFFIICYNYNFLFKLKWFWGWEYSMYNYSCILLKRFDVFYLLLSNLSL